MNTLESINNSDIDRIKNRPILDIAASFWEEERYNAFKTCYRSMRVIDDLVDDRKIISADLFGKEKMYYTTQITNWVNSIRDKTPQNSVQEKLLETIAKFQIPLWPWIEFSESMIYDLNNNGFNSLNTFVKYSEGAAISPGSIFMHLCGVNKINGYYLPPKFDVRKAARSLSLFSYLVHVIRDFQKDQNNNLNYIPNRLINESGLTNTALKDIAVSGNIGFEFRELMKWYYKIIKHYRNKSRNMLDKMDGSLQPRYKLSLEIIYSLYLQIFERIDIQNGNFTSEELNPSEEEIQTRVKLILSEFQSVTL